MNAIIVDDEAPARENLSRKIQKLDSSIQIVGEAADVTEAVQLINNQKIDIVFLDIELPGDNGFSLFNNFTNPSFSVVFVTAYNQYAVTAFQHLALGYILKPINNNLLLQTIQHVKRTKAPNLNQQIVTELRSLIQSDSRLAIPMEKGLEMINMNDIVYLEADEGYTTIYLIDENTKLSSKRLVYFEEKLNANDFLRIHRKFIVNKNAIVNYSRRGSVKMVNNKELPVSKNFRNEVKDILLK